MLIEGQDYQVRGRPSVSAQMRAISTTEPDLRELLPAICRKSDVVQIYWSRTKLLRGLPP